MSVDAISIDVSSVSLAIVKPEKLDGFLLRLWCANRADTGLSGEVNRRFSASFFSSEFELEDRLDSFNGEIYAALAREPGDSSRPHISRL